MLPSNVLAASGDSEVFPWIPADPPSLESFFTITLHPVPLLPALGIALAVLYLLGAIRMWRTGRRWSVLRTALFLLGCGMIVVVTGTRLEDYGFALFSVFMFQQLTLMMVIPPLLVLGAPGTLLLRATPHRGGGQHVLRAALWGLRSWPARMLIHPGFTIPLFFTSFYGLYLAGLADLLLASWPGHIALQIMFLGAGILFTTPVLSVDPLPRRQSPLVRLAEHFVDTTLHTCFGLIMLLTTVPVVAAFSQPPAAWGIDPLYDQQIAGALVWTYAELPSAIILIYLLNKWFRYSTRRDKAADGRADATGDPDLVAYNAYLDSLRRL